MNEEINNSPVDNVDTIMVSDDINTIQDSKALLPVDDLSKDMVESEEGGKVGRPAHLPNADTRNKVYTLSTVGTRHEDIASVLNISHDTLVKYYKEELDKGRIEANASVAETLFKQAKEGNTTAMIFWLKSRAKWKESTQHEISGNPDGTPVEVKIVTGIEYAS
jgi:phosphohistidine phosphatase SixA